MVRPHPSPRCVVLLGDHSIVIDVLGANIVCMPSLDLGQWGTNKDQIDADVKKPKKMSLGTQSLYYSSDIFVWWKHWRNEHACTVGKMPHFLSCLRRNVDFEITVLPRLVRMRTIKLMSFFEKKPSNFEQFLEIFGIFEQRNLDLK